MSLFPGKLRLTFNDECRLKSSCSEVFKSAARVNFDLRRREYVSNLEGLRSTLHVGQRFFQVVGCLWVSRLRCMDKFFSPSTDMRSKLWNVWGVSNYRTQSRSVHFAVQLWVLVGYGCISTVDYETSSNWPPERFPVMTQNNVQKLELSTKIDIYSHRRRHRRACCSCRTLCRDSGALMCNTQSRNSVKMTRKFLTSRVLPSIQIVGFRSVLLSPYKLTLSLRHWDSACNGQSLKNSDTVGVQCVLLWQRREWNWIKQP
jgi:hypothetical protein